MPLLPLYRPVLAIFYLLLLAGPSAIDSAVAAEPANPNPLDELLTAVARDQLPHDYENRKHWGRTTEIWDGLHIARDGLRIKTKRRKKEVNDGTWKMYRVRLIDPREHLTVGLENVRDLGDGRAAFDVVADGRLAAFGRLSQWVKGVQLVSVSADADARVQMRISFEMTMRLDFNKLPPDVLLSPRATQADIRLVEFRLRRISDAHGPLVKELGDSLRHVLNDELEDRRHKLAEKINAKLDKSRDKLRLSPHDLLSSKWNEVAVKLGLEQP